MLGKQRHVRYAVVQKKCVLLQQLLVADNYILHLKVPALHAVRTQNRGQYLSHRKVNDILVDHVFVNNGQITSDPRFEQLFCGEFFDIPLIHLIQRIGFL